jgi:hypothetical protein
MDLNICLSCYFSLIFANAHWLIGTLMITDPILLAKNVTPRLLRCSSFSNILVVFIAHAIANFQKMWLLAAATLTPIVLP